MIDLTLISCSFNTPEVTINMLKSFLYTNGPCKLKLMENSTDDQTSKLLDDLKIDYTRNNGLGHSLGVQLALDSCTDDYALLVDTDVLFFKSIHDIFNEFKSSGDIIWGEYQRSRGGYQLVDRINPWFCFLNLDLMRKNLLLFHDQGIVDRSMSHKFFRQPLQEPVSRSKLYYDVGSSLLESVKQKGLGYKEIRLQPEYFKHFEGMSWRKTDEERALQISGFQTEIEYKMFIKGLNEINCDITGAYK